MKRPDIHFWVTEKTGENHKQHLSLFAYFLIVEAMLLFSMAGAFLVLTLYNSSSDERTHPGFASGYTHLFENYKVLSSFLYLPTESLPELNPEENVKSPFIKDILIIKSAADIMGEKDSLEKKISLISEILSKMDPEKMHPYALREKNKLVLRILFLQKKYREVTALWETTQVDTPSALFLTISSYIKTGENEKAFNLFKKAFPAYPLSTLENYIPGPILKEFLTRIDEKLIPVYFKKLLEENKYSEFKTCSKYWDHPQMIASFHAEFSFNRKDYAASRRFIDSITHETLLGNKLRIQIKLELRKTEYEVLKTQLDELKQKADSTLYLSTLMDIGGALFARARWDDALKIFSRYVSFADETRDPKYLRTHEYWKALWYTAWLYYRQGDKAKAEAFFKRGCESGFDSFKVSNAYWFNRLTGRKPINMDHFSFTYYYAKIHLDGTDIDPVKTLKPFIKLVNQPQGKQLETILRPLSELVRYNLTENAADYIHRVLNDPAAKLEPVDRTVLKLLESIIYLKQKNYSMAYVRYKTYFVNYQWMRLPRFLSRVVLPAEFTPAILQYAKENNIEPGLIYSLIREESFFRPNAVSPANAYGLMQLLVPTAQKTAIPLAMKVQKQDLFNPQINLRLGIRHLRDLLDMNENKPFLVLAGYNAGQGRVNDWQNNFGHLSEEEFIEMIPFTETRNYVKNILRNCFFYRFYYGN